MTDLNPPDYKSELEDLAAKFEGFAVEHPKAPDSPPQSPWDGVDLRKDLLQRSELQRPMMEFRGSVNRAGELVIQAYRAGLLETDGLPELVAAHDLNDWNGLVESPANLFALLIGGPRIELSDSGGNVAEYCKPNPGWPLQYFPAEARGPTDILNPSQRLNSPDPEQCRFYAHACRAFADAIPEQRQCRPREDKLVVMLTMGTRCFVLNATTARRHISLTEVESRVFSWFVHNVARSSPEEVVPWRPLNAAVEDPSDSMQCPNLAKLLSNLNKRLSDWVQTPDGEPWIDTKKGTSGGRFLNASVQWMLDESDDLIRRFKYKSNSVEGVTVDPRTMAEATPNPGEKLPARRKSKQSSDNDFQDDDDA